MKIREILMTKGNRVFKVTPQQSIREGAKLLAEYNIGAVMVVDANGKLLGVMSERDIVREAVKIDGLLFDEQISTIMTTDLIIASPEDDVNNAAHAMTERNIRHLPVMDDNDLIGVISIKDLLDALQTRYEGEIHHLREYVGTHTDVTH